MRSIPRRTTLAALAVLFLLTPSLSAVEPEYFAVFFEGKKVGHVKFTRAVAGGKVTTTTAMSMTLNRCGVPLAIKTSETSVETAEGKPLSFETTLDMAIMAVRHAGTIDENGKLTVRSTVGGQTTRKDLDWPEGALLPEGIRLLEKSKGLKEGTKYTVRTYDTSMLRAIDGDVVVGTTRRVSLLLGETRKLTEIKITLKMGTGTIESLVYADDEANAVKTTMAMMGMNMEIIACTKEQALAPNEDFDALDRFLLACPTPLGRLAANTSVAYTLKVTNDKKLTFPATDNQTVKVNADGSIALTVAPARGAAGATFPYQGDDETALTALKPAEFIQCDDKKLIALARKAVGKTTDGAQAVRRIEAFVFQYIRKKHMGVGYASASEVVRTREGDCTEHAVLAAGLCRAVGIPAQVVTGMCYVPEIAGKKHVFGGHAWARAFVGGKWIGLDAALGRYDAGHIALATGNGKPDDFFDAVPLLGNFTVTAAKVLDPPKK